MPVAKPAPLSQEDVERYGDVLAQIKGRVEHAVGILDNVSDLFDLESAALQLRKAIELVALATFAVNRQHIEGITTALHKKRWDDAQKLIRRVNPDYWPVPFEPKPDASGKVALEPIEESFLTEADAGREFGYLSDLIHAENPFAPRTVDSATIDRVRQTAKRLGLLLGRHTVDLGGREHLIVAQMEEGPDGGVAVHVLDQV